MGAVRLMVCCLQYADICGFGCGASLGATRRRCAREFMGAERLMVWSTICRRMWIWIVALH